MSTILDERATAKEPYGPASQAHYADPGYQADKQKRYPLDSADHCRAAWSYINMPKNAAKYTPEQLAAIKGRIKAAGDKYGISFADSDRADGAVGEFRRAIFGECVRAFDFETAGSGDGRSLEGYAAVFGQTSRIADLHGDFDEEIMPGAFTRSLNKRKPVLQWEHGKDPRVGHVPIGAISDIAEDSKGLHVRARLFDNDVVRPLQQAMAAKAVTGMSFRFMVAQGGDVWKPGHTRGGVDHRAVLDADVPEVSPVVFPAYDQTTVSLRSMLATLDDGEIRTLIRELAAHVGLAVDLSNLTGRPTARSSGGGDFAETPGGVEATARAALNQARHRALLIRGLVKE